MKLSKIKFGRLPEFDPRSRNYPIRALIAEVKPRSYTWRCLLNLDQGNTPACTGFAVTHEAAARPVEVPNLTNAIALKVYKRAQQLDEYEGEDYEGSSVLGAVKAGTERGWYGSYRWGFSEEDLCLTVGHWGPCVIGIPWLSDMMSPNSEGLVHASGYEEGGHAILVNSINIKKRLYGLKNSWGVDFGIGGSCYLSRDDMAKLLAMEGECCVPIKRLKG